MDWRTQRQFFTHLEDSHVKSPTNKEFTKLYKAMANTIATIIDNPNSLNALDDDQVEQMVRFSFNVDTTGHIVNDKEAGTAILTNKPDAYKKLKERYETIHP